METTTIVEQIKNLNDNEVIIIKQISRTILSSDMSEGKHIRHGEMGMFIYRRPSQEEISEGITSLIEVRFCKIIARPHKVFDNFWLNSEMKSNINSSGIHQEFNIFSGHDDFLGASFSKKRYLQKNL